MSDDAGRPTGSRASADSAEIGIVAGLAVNLAFLVALATV
jgi:hypothetical protein